MNTDEEFYSATADDLAEKAGRWFTGSTITPAAEPTEAELDQMVADEMRFR